MIKIGTVACLLALISAGGGNSAFRPLSGGPNSTPGAIRARAALMAAFARASDERQKGDYATALEHFLAGYREARRSKELGLEARFLWGIANCHFAQRHYREALREYIAARDAFSNLHESGRLSAVNGNLASLYAQLGEPGPAIESARLALAQNTPPDPFGRQARLLILLGVLLAQDGQKDEAKRLFAEGIVEAGRFDDSELLSNAWDRLGSELLLWNEPSSAEDALLEAYRIRKLNRLPSLAGSYRKLGLLRLEQGDLRSAAALLDASVTESKAPGGRIPEWCFYHARGRLRLSEGRIEQAHSDFSVALELARNYRLMTPPSDSTRVSLESYLQKVYASFIETGARLNFESGRSHLAREAFEALEENRGSSLAERLRERRQFRRDMPEAYWDALAELQSAEAELLLNNEEGPRQTMRRLRGAIVEMESKAGGAAFSLRPDLVAQLQKSLDGDTALLSFQLGRTTSLLWAVSSSGLSLYRLPGRASITASARQFRDAIVNGGASGAGLGRELYRTLFGGLGPQYGAKSRWLLSLDEGLFELPFAALVVSERQNAPRYLIESHSIRIVSGAANWLDSPKNRQAHGPFVGIGDAVYNRADMRWRGPTRDPARNWLESTLHWPWRANAVPRATLGLSRLPGSGREVEACASEWRGGAALLEGFDATRQNVRRLVEARPAVVHFATHVLQDPERSTNALIALSVSEDGSDELLGPAEIGGWSAVPNLVVLSGCSSGVAVALPGAGLMGMTRAWLMAGAGAVIATEWSTSDDVGVFFRRFYRELQRSESFDPAGALRTAQLETLRSGSWRSHPGFWAAYFTMGNY